MSVVVRQHLSSVSALRIVIATTFCIWLNMVVMPQATTFISHELPTATGITLLRLAIAISVVVSSVIIFIRWRPQSFIFPCVFIAICLCPSSLLEALLNVNEPFNALSNVICFVNGFGIGTFLVLASLMYSSSNAATVLFETTVAMSLSVPLFFLNSIIPNPALAALTYAFAIFSSVLMYVFLQREVKNVDSKQYEPAKLVSSIPKREMLLPVGLAVYGFILASGHFLYYSRALDTSLNPSLSVVLSVGIVLAIVAIVLFVYSVFPSFRIYFITLIPLVFTCMFLPSIASSVSGYSIALVSDIVLFLYLCWVLPFDATNVGSRIRPFFVGLCTGFGQLGLLFGIMLGHELNIDDPLNNIQRNRFFALIVILAFLAAALVFIAFWNRPDRKRESKAHKAKSEQNESLIQERCIAICREAGISDRSSEVTALYALGRTRSRIAQMLFISESTVNFHLGKAYQRLGISSKQELLDLVYRESKTDSNS